MTHLVIASGIDRRNAQRPIELDRAIEMLRKCVAGSSRSGRCSHELRIDRFGVREVAEMGRSPPHPIEVEEWFQVLRQGLRTGRRVMSHSDGDNSTKLEVVLMSGILSFTKTISG